MKTPKIGIITVNWRNYKDTIECLESLLKQDYPDHQIFILDNGSNDGSAECIAEWGREKLGNDFFSVEVEDAEQLSFNQKVILLESRENLGFTGGNNLACRVAMKTGAKYVWFINNDTVQDSGALSALVNAAKSDVKAGMVGSKVLYFGKPDVVESIGSTLILPIGVFRHIRQGNRDSDVPPILIKVPYVYGCSFLVKAALMEDVGLMDERYFLLREESDWSIRARRKGWKLYSALNSRVWHKGTTSIGKRSETFFYYVTRNTFLFMREHYPIFLPITVLFMLPLLLGLVLVDSFFLDRKAPIGRLKMVAIGYIHFFKGKFGRL